MALQLILPRSALDPPRQVLLCTLCGKKLPLEQKDQFVRHVKACLKRNPEIIEEAVAARESNIFQSPADQELYEHIRKGGT
jgi:hypothetical protein